MPEQVRKNMRPERSVLHEPVTILVGPYVLGGGIGAWFRSYEFFWQAKLGDVRVICGQLFQLSYRMKRKYLKVECWWTPVLGENEYVSYDELRAFTAAVVG